MSRPFILLSGEFRITLPLVFQHDNWIHSQSAKILYLNDDKSFHRHNIDEHLLGCIYHAGVSDDTIRRQNFNFLIDNNIPCYPDPKILLSIDDRHACMEKVIRVGLNTNVVIQCKYETFGTDIPLKYPFVVKTGNEHQGQGKFLVKNESELPKWDGIATIEPFFDGISCRVLWIDDDYFTLRFDNDFSWVKNTNGAEVSLYPEMPQAVIDHSRKVKSLFGLDVCGIDYIVGKDGWWFLEFNYAPGVDVSDACTEAVNKFFGEKMKWVEEQSEIR
jgi:glutathione synthase/RimK-type ligase-like ATP-grasp enzyme